MAGAAAAAAEPVAELRFESDVVTQDQIRHSFVSFNRVRLRGLEVFSTPFTKDVGYGDGPMNPLDPTAAGGRPTLQANGSYLRVNGLDAQSCLECHSVQSALTIPSTFGIGGAGGSGVNVLARPTDIDVVDQAGQGFAGFNGRFINPPFVFGSGGVELLAKEMTQDLQLLLARAKASPGREILLITKGVSFGSIRYVDGEIDTSQVQGIDDDLVVRPFGRKGEFLSVRNFDIGAMIFHFGMQPIEEVGFGIDDDADGVANEVSAGDMSALSIFLTTLERPVQDALSFEAQQGERLFRGLGCGGCHRSALRTRAKELTHSFPEVATDPTANVYYRVRLDRGPAGFDTAADGLEVRLFSDLRRHDMGPGLAENVEKLPNEFITARLWGVADSAPYLHDGRAHTLNEAIRWHGGEAQEVRDAYVALPPVDQQKVVAFLMTLRTPPDPAADLAP